MLQCGWNVYHYMKQKKPDTKDHVLYDSILMKFFIKDRRIETERKSVVGRCWEESRD